MNFGTALVENKSDLKSPLKIETNMSMSINKVPLNPRMNIVVKPDQMDVSLTENGTKISMDSSSGIIVVGEKFQTKRTFLGTKDFNVVNATNKKKIPLLNSYFISTSKDPSFIEVGLKKAFKESYNKRLKNFLLKVFLWFMSNLNLVYTILKGNLVLKQWLLIKIVHS